MLGISSVAPAYTLTATIGSWWREAGTKMPMVIIAGFLPMFFAAYAYREFNKVDPDCGTSFTWTTKAFGPYVGWLGGWAAVLATIIVLANLAGVGVQFFYQLLGNVFDNDDIGDAVGEQGWSTCSPAWCSWRSPPRSPTAASPPPRRSSSSWSASSWSCWWCSRSWRSPRPASPDDRRSSFSWDWFNPFTGLTLSAFIAGLSASIFSFWGWDTALTVNEESKDSDKTPGRAALLCVLSILLTYLLVVDRGPDVRR